jgi:Zn-dependent protease
VSADAIYLITIWAIPVIVAITFHEAAHGFVAHLLGDDTAWRLGRVSFNPLKHVDPFGTVLLPGILLLLRSPFIFGYAKPVPVNFRALRWPRRGMVLVAAAGPAMNIALAVAAALAFHIRLLTWCWRCSICFRCHLSMAGAFWSGFSRRPPLRLLRVWSRMGWQS